MDAMVDAGTPAQYAAILATLRKNAADTFQTTVLAAQSASLVTDPTKASDTHLTFLKAVKCHQHIKHFLTYAEDYAKLAESTGKFEFYNIKYMMDCVDISASHSADAKNAMNAIVNGEQDSYAKSMLDEMLDEYTKAADKYATDVARDALVKTRSYWTAKKPNPDFIEEAIEREAIYSYTCAKKFGVSVVNCGDAKVLSYVATCIAVAEKRAAECTSTAEKRNAEKEKRAELEREARMADEKAAKKKRDRHENDAWIQEHQARMLVDHTQSAAKAAAEPVKAAATRAAVMSSDTITVVAE